MRIPSILAASLAFGAAAVPAAAQYQPYPQPGYGYGQPNGPLSGAIAQILGNRYNGVSDRGAINQCAAAAAQQAARTYPAARQPYGNAYGWNQRYPGYARVTAITNVERRNRNNLRVTGLIDTGRYRYAQSGYSQGDLRFRCNVDFAGRVTDVRLNRLR